jgi:hypothetical protein
VGFLPPNENLCYKVVVPDLIKICSVTMSPGETMLTAASTVAAYIIIVIVTVVTSIAMVTMVTSLVLILLMGTMVIMLTMVR